MEQIASVVKVVMLALLASVSQGVTTYDTSAGRVYRLDVTQDVTLERGSFNLKYLQYLIVAKFPERPNKRSLVQFEDLPSSCPTEHIQSAKMYLFYEYAHKPKKFSDAQAPFIPRYLEVHLVKKPWNEAEATSTWRLSNISWSSPWLGLDGTDAEAAPQPDTVTISRNSTTGFVEFDVINAVKSWSEGVANNGLVIRATNELDPGRDIRFASNAVIDSSEHAYILVHCVSPGAKTGSPATSSSMVVHTSPKPTTMLSHTSAKPSTTPIHTSLKPSTTLSHTSSQPSTRLSYTSPKPSTTPSHTNLKPSTTPSHTNSKPSTTLSRISPKPSTILSQSNAMSDMSDSSKYVHILVRCASTETTTVSPTPSRSVISQTSPNPNAIPVQTNNPSNRKAVEPAKQQQLQLHNDTWSVNAMSLIFFILGFLVAAVSILSFLGASVYFQLIQVKFLFRKSGKQEEPLKSVKA